MRLMEVGDWVSFGDIDLDELTSLCEYFSSGTVLVPENKDIEEELYQSKLEMFEGHPAIERTEKGLEFKTPGCLVVGSNVEEKLLQAASLKDLRDCADILLDQVVVLLVSEKEGSYRVIIAPPWMDIDFEAEEGELEFMKAFYGINLIRA
jgi:hypothetical protein